jgi:hypothetical protein
MDLLNEFVVGDRQTFLRIYATYTICVCLARFIRLTISPTIITALSSSSAILFGDRTASGRRRVCIGSSGAAIAHCRIADNVGQNARRQYARGDGRAAQGALCFLCFRCFSVFGFGFISAFAFSQFECMVLMLRRSDLRCVCFRCLGDLMNETTSVVSTCFLFFMCFFSWCVHIMNQVSFKLTPLSHTRHALRHR